MNEAHTERGLADAKREWTKPVLDELDVRETANGNIGSDGLGGGSQQTGNSSGS